MDCPEYGGPLTGPWGGNTTWAFPPAYSSPCSLFGPVTWSCFHVKIQPVHHVYACLYQARGHLPPQHFSTTTPFQHRIPHWVSFIPPNGVCIQCSLLFYERDGHRSWQNHLVQLSPGFPTCSVWGLLHTSIYCCWCARQPIIISPLWLHFLPLYTPPYRLSLHPHLICLCIWQWLCYTSSGRFIQPTSGLL